jgi:hypothetical protein
VTLKVESIADKKLVIHLETPVLEREFSEPELRAVQQRTDGKGGGLTIFQCLAQEVEAQTGVHQVLHNEHLAPLNALFQVPGNLHLPVGRALRAKASKRQEIEHDRSLNPADQITGKKEGAVENCHDYRIPIAVIPRDLAPQPPDCTRNVLFA